MRQFAQVSRLEGGRIGRGAEQEIADETTLAHRVGPVTLVFIGIAAGKPCHLAVGHLRVVVGAEVVAIFHERDRAAVGRHLQAVSVQFQRAVDLGA